MVDNKSAKNRSRISGFTREKKCCWQKLKAERERRIKEEEAKEQTQKKREELKKTHWMCCPKCGDIQCSSERLLFALRWISARSARVSILTGANSRN